MSRHLDERLALRAPRLYRRVRKSHLLALPTGSALRGRVASRGLARALEALTRGDYEVVLLDYDPDVQIRVIGNDALAIGFAEQYHGHDGYRELTGRWREGWLSARFTPTALIDLGDRWVAGVTVTGRGPSSGAEVAHTFGYVLDLRDGAIVRMDVYWDWTECLDALGLDSSASSAAAVRP